MVVQRMMAEIFNRLLALQIQQKTPREYPSGTPKEIAQRRDVRMVIYKFDTLSYIN